MWRRFFGLAGLTGMLWLAASIPLTGCDRETSGADLYTLNCAGCHGPAGKGGLAAALSVPAYLASHDDAMMARITGEGVPSTGMRAFGSAKGGTLTDDQIVAIVKYLRSIRAAD